MGLNDEKTFGAKDVFSPQFTEAVEKGDWETVWRLCDEMKGFCADLLRHFDTTEEILACERSEGLGPHRSTTVVGDALELDNFQGEELRQEILRLAVAGKIDGYIQMYKEEYDRSSEILQKIMAKYEPVRVSER